MAEEASSSPSRGLLRETVRVAWPAVLESFFVSLANMIDTLMVSSLGSSCVAAVGLTAQPKFLSLSVFMSVNVAVSALVARRRGEQDPKSAGHILATGIALVTLACTLISTICVVFAGPIIHLCGSQPDTHEDATLYFTIIMSGMIFTALQLVINAAQRGSGNTRIAMTTNVTSSIVNMCGNYLLIGGHFGFPALGIRGAALATVFGSAVACCMSIRSLWPADCFVNIRRIWREKLWPDLTSLKSIFGLSGSLLCENLLMRVGFISTAVMAAGLGTAAFAAHQVGMNVMNLAFSLGDGMQAAAVALIGRSLGERKPDQAKKFGAFCQRIGLSISLVLSALLILFGRFYYGLFFREPEIIELGLIILRYLCLVVLFQISQVIFSGALRGAGDVRYTMKASLFSVAIIRTAMTALLVQVMGLGLVGIWLGILSDQATRCIFMAVRFYRGKWIHLKI